MEYNITSKMTDVYIPKTDLEKIVLKNIDHDDINWKLLSLNPNITWDFRFTFQNMISDMDWDVIYQTLEITLPIFEKYKLHEKPNIDFFLSKNRIFDLRIVKSYPDLNWDWDELSKHDRIDLDFLIHFIEKDFDWYYLTDNYSCRSHNPIYYDKALLENPDLPWKWEIISYNSDLSIETIFKLKDKNWNWMYLTSDQKTLDFIDKYSDLPWLWYAIDDSILNTEFIRKYHMKNWNWTTLTENQFITQDFILEFPDLDYDWHAFGPNELRDIDTIVRFKDENLNWKELSLSCGLTEKDIDNNINLPWDWNSLSMNINISYDFVEKHSDKPWNYTLICMNRFQYDYYPTMKTIEFSEIDMYKAKEKLDIYREELMKVTCHPNRVIDWCMSIDEIVN